MKITHSKNYQHIQVPEIEYSQYEIICDEIFTRIPNKIISTQYRKKLKTGFFVLMNQAITTRVLVLFSDPPEVPKKSTKKVEKKTPAKKGVKK